MIGRDLFLPIIELLGRAAFRTKAVCVPWRFSRASVFPDIENRKDDLFEIDATKAACRVVLKPANFIGGALNERTDGNDIQHMQSHGRSIDAHDFLADLKT